MITYRASESVYCATGAVNGLSHLAKLTTSKGAGTADSIRIGQSLSNRIESDDRFEFESNLEASQVPNINLTSFCFCSISPEMKNAVIRVVMACVVAMTSAVAPAQAEGESCFDVQFYARQHYAERAICYRNSVRPFVTRVDQSKNG